MLYKCLVNMIRVLNNNEKLTLYTKEFTFLKIEN